MSSGGEARGQRGIGISLGSDLALPLPCEIPYSFDVQRSALGSQCAWKLPADSGYSLYPATMAQDQGQVRNMGPGRAGREQGRAGHGGPASPKVLSSLRLPRRRDAGAGAFPGSGRASVEGGCWGHQVQCPQSVVTPPPSPSSLRSLPLPDLPLRTGVSPAPQHSRPLRTSECNLCGKCCFCRCKKLH